MRITGEISKADIRRGKRGASHSCPLALSLVRCGFHDNQVLVFDFRATMDGYVYRGSLSKKMVDWVANFDENKPVKPTRFRLDAR